MADVSAAKSFPESNITTTPEEADIVLGKTTSSLAYKVDKKANDKAMEELSENFNLERDSLRSLIHGLRSGLNHELKRETEGQGCQMEISTSSGVVVKRNVRHVCLPPATRSYVNT